LKQPQIKGILMPDTEKPPEPAGAPAGAPGGGGTGHWTFFLEKTDFQRFF
jgi:hypothetical protein